MITDKNINNYGEDIEQTWHTGQAREHAYRPALHRLMNSFNNVDAVNEPPRSQYGNPDFVFLKKSEKTIILGYAETKDITVDLDKIEKTEQLSRYSGYENLFLTNYLEFRFFRNGEKYQIIKIGKIKDAAIELYPQYFEELQSELQAFLDLPPERIKSGKRLAEIMGGKAYRIRNNVAEYLVHDNNLNEELDRIYNMMKELLVHDLSTEKFADMYAQTLVYGLFVARYNDNTPDNFTRNEARDLVPASNPFLRDFFDHIVGPHFDIRLGYIVDELCEIFSVSDIKNIVHKHLKVTDVNSDDRDPIIHFYEDFLQAYDPNERKKMGAYYTPLPIVRFIVRSVDAILRDVFALPKGLADTSKKSISIDRSGVKGKFAFHRVQVLDPAVGTATFLNEVIKHIYNGFKGQEGLWPSYTETDLIPRLYGFELMMAPYTIAHLKLGMTLQESGIKNFKRRLGVYLTNTLEEGVKIQQDLFSIGLAEAISREASEAAYIKSERPIMVIMGNPPYSGVSSNETAYANSLIDKYKVEPGGVVKLQERKHWLNDDYVRFIAFAEDMIAKNGEGVVGMITNHGYLDNPTFRGMRWHLTQTFDEIKVLDLHGNAKKQEISPDGSKDENVFNIQQGVAILIATKTGNKRKGQAATIYHADLFGTRKHKFSELSNINLEWQEVSLDKSMYTFAKRDIEGQSKYQKGIKLSNLFIVYNTSVVTMGDKFIVSDDKEVLADRINQLIEGAYTEQKLNHEFGLGKNYAKWVLENSKNLVFDASKIVSISYRPFDDRYTYFDNKVVWRPRTNVMTHFLKGDNLGLVYRRQQLPNRQTYYFVASNIIADGLIRSDNKGGEGIAPLYLYHSDGTKTPNFESNALKQLTSKLQNVYKPEDILDYIYAVLYSPSYREKYEEFLKDDYPYVPIPKNGKQFNELAGLGLQLRKLHLMTDPALNDISTTFSELGSNVVERITYEDNKVWINGTQYFGNVPNTAWELFIGGYQPAQKWLKDRKNTKLTSQEIMHYQQIIKVLIETDEIMNHIDKIELT